MALTYFELVQARDWAMYALGPSANAKIVLDASDLTNTERWFLRRRVLERPAGPMQTGAREDVRADVRRVVQSVRRAVRRDRRADLRPLSRDVGQDAPGGDEPGTRARTVSRPDRGPFLLKKKDANSSLDGCQLILKK